jgi:hypothetical protein
MSVTRISTGSAYWDILFRYKRLQLYFLINLQFVFSKKNIVPVRIHCSRQMGLRNFFRLASRFQIKASSSTTEEKIRGFYNGKKRTRESWIRSFKWEVAKSSILREHFLYRKIDIQKLRFMGRLLKNCSATFLWDCHFKAQIKGLTFSAKLNN